MGTDIDMVIDSDMSVSINWRILEGSCRAPFKGFGVDVRQVEI